MIQGGIEGGLDDAFCFGDARPAPLDSRLRENDGNPAKVSPRWKSTSNNQDAGKAIQLPSMGPTCAGMTVTREWLGALQWGFGEE